MDVLCFRGDGVLLRLPEAGLQQRLDLLPTGAEAVLRRQEAVQLCPLTLTLGQVRSAYTPDILTRTKRGPMLGHLLLGSVDIDLPGPRMEATTLACARGTHRVTPDGLSELLGHLLRHVAASRQPGLKSLHRRHHAAGRHHGRGARDELHICTAAGQTRGRHHTFQSTAPTGASRTASCVKRRRRPLGDTQPYSGHQATRRRRTEPRPLHRWLNSRNDRNTDRRFLFLPRLLVSMAMDAGTRAEAVLG